MQTTEAIRTRHSVRQYTHEKVAPDAVEALLRAAMQAPSACNQQPWHFVVITDHATLNRIPQISPHAQMCASAPLAILVCGDTRSLVAEGYWPQDCAAATENLLLAAHDAGLGAVWTGIYPRHERVDAFRSLFALPDGVLPFCLVVIGHPDEPSEPEDRYQPARVHHDKW